MGRSLGEIKEIFQEGSIVRNVSSVRVYKVVKAYPHVPISISNPFYGNFFILVSTTDHKRLWWYQINLQNWVLENPVKRKPIEWE